MSATLSKIRTDVNTFLDVRQALQQLVLAIALGLYTPSGSAGGDLSGSYPNPTVAKINGATVPLGSGLSPGELLYASNTGIWQNLAANSTVTPKFLREVGNGTIATSIAWSTIAESDVANLVSDLAAKVPTTRNVNTTAPITGGGALSGDLTIAISDATATTRGAVPTPPNDATKVFLGNATWGAVPGGSTLTQPQVLARVCRGA